MKEIIRFKQISRTGFVLLFAVLTCLGILSCKKLDFTKTEIEIPADDTWLFYDNGSNYDGISANWGGDFDIAIRFSMAQIANYQGYIISKVKFFPIEGYPAAYSITLWQGGDPPSLIQLQSVPTVIAGVWNEVSLDDLFYVDASQDMWVGVWIQDYPLDTHPAGCDSGPAVAGKGDLFSNDDGASWYSLYNENNDFNYNWNLRVLLISPYGQKVMLGDADESIPQENKEALKKSHAGPGNDRVNSLKMYQAHENN